MLLFTYDDYLRCKKILYSRPMCVKENLANYSYNSESIHHLHDKLYRDLLNNKKEFCLFLKNFLRISIAENLLEPYNRSFISTNYNDKYADIVYKLSDEPVYFLLEHQSYVDYRMPYRIFDYYTELLRYTVNKDDLNKTDYKMPCICVIVFYTGTGKWNLKPNLNNYQYSYEYVPNFDIPFYFVSNNKYSKDKLLNFKSCISFVMAVEHCKNESEMYGILTQFAEFIKTVEQKNFFRRFLFYIVNELLDKKHSEILLNKLNESEVIGDMSTSSYGFIDRCIIKKQKEKIMEEERLRKLERASRREGLKEGRKEGMKEGFITVIKNMLDNGEDIEKICLYSGFSKSEVENLMQTH